MCAGTLADFLRISVLLALVFLLAANKVHGQPDGPDVADFAFPRTDWSIGLSISVLYNHHSGGSRPPDTSCSLDFTGGAPGYGFGLSAEFLPNVNGRWGMIPGLLYEHRPGKARGKLVGESQSHDVSVVYDLLTFGILYKYDYLATRDLRIGVAAGPSFQYALRKEIESDVEDVSLFCSEEVQSNVRFSAKMGVQGEFPLFDNRWLLVTGLWYDYGFPFPRTYRGDIDWRVNSLMLQVDFRKWM